MYYNLEDLVESINSGDHVRIALHYWSIIWIIERISVARFKKVNVLRTRWGSKKMERLGRLFGNITLYIDKRSGGSFPEFLLYVKMYIKRLLRDCSKLQ